MDEQRLEAYLNLIQQLLSCSSGQEPDILNANRELVDAGLVQVMAWVTERMAQQGKPNAERLQTIAVSIITKMLEDSSSSTTLEDYLSFLEELLLAALESNGDSQRVNQVLRRNLDKLDEIFAQIFPQGATNFIANFPEAAESTLALVENISIRIQEFPLGNIAINQEIAIAGYKIVIRNREANTEKWAQTQNNLGEAYRNRILGDRAKNLEEAIARYKDALQVSTREAFPTDWAQTQNNLAVAYSDRILGDRAQNLEEAIARFQNALQVRTREAFPVQWAITQDELAAAYGDRIRGDRAQNLEQAIACCQNALQVLTREAFPTDWAITQKNLANAYLYRIQGDRAQNLEQAIACYENGLQVYTREAFPEGWAGTQDNLATAYNKRIQGDRAQNLEQAIARYQNALQVYTRSAFPKDWAGTQNNLATAYGDRIQGDRAQNLEQAIACYENALQVYTRQAFPEQWAMTQNNLANAYSQRIQGDRAQNLEEAIARYQDALQVSTRSAFPVDWAKTQNNLANAYSQRIQGDRAQNLEEAISCYQNALQVYTPTTFPFECLGTGSNLGNLAFTEGNWQLAIKGYTQAIAAVEQSRAWATNDERRQEILAESIGVYEKMVQACINNGQLDKAIEYAERSRSQRLVDLMASNDLYAGSDIPPQVQEYLQQFADKQRQIDQLRQGNYPSKERELAGSTRSRAKLKEENAVIQALEQEKQQIWQQIRQLDPVLSGQIQVAAPDLAAMQKLIDDDKTAILSFYTTTNNTHVFVLRKDGGSCHSCQGQGREALQRWIFENWLKPYLFDKPAWMRNIGGVLGELAHRLQLSKLVAEHLEGIEELIIVPHLYLHQIPFGALPLDPSQPSSSSLKLRSLRFKRGEQEEAEVSVSLLSKEVQPNRPVPPLNKEGLGGVNPLTLENTPPQPSSLKLRLVRGEQEQEEAVLVPPLVKGGLGGDRPTTNNHDGILSDQFLIRYVPSCQILDYCQNRPAVTTPTEYGTIEDATEDLPCSSFEGEQIAQLYQIPENRRHRGRQNATVANYRQLAQQVQGILSTHHAQSRLDNPLHSELLLADGSITLGELLTPGWRLPQLVDVFLSCCETGLGLPKNLTDDILTLSFGFLCAGARSVVSTLWAVDDLATALFSLFYHHNKQQLSRPAALKKAQEQLRTLTGETLAQEYKPTLQPLLQEKLAQTIETKKQAYAAYKQAKKQSLNTLDDWKKELNRIDKIQEKVEKAIQRLNSACKEPFPFSAYFYWSAFTCQGLR